MKTFLRSQLVRVVAVLLGLLFLTSHAYAQGDDCDLILQNGLYSQFNMTNTGNFNQDFKTYLLSDQFFSDIKTGKWGGSITVPIEGVPVSLGANASNEEWATFKQRILNATSWSVSSSYYQTITSSIPNVDLARVFADCLMHRTGFSVTATSGSDWASFNIHYIKANSQDTMPKVVSLEVRNGTRINTALRVGRKILDSNLVTAKRDSKKDTVLFLQTDRGTAVYKIPGQPTADLSKDVPIGTVIASLLAPDKFYSVSSANENSPGGTIWTASGSRWSPADGRIVPGSKFEQYASLPNVPDLRGMFLRGVNIYDQVPQVPIDRNKKDPDDRAAGTFQGDSTKMPNTAFSAATNGTAFVGTVDVGSHDNGSGNACPDGRRQLGVTISGGDFETRPKNVAVYYYVRIN